MIRDRLTRAEGQVKIGNDRALHIEAALEQSRSQNWALERTVQQLHDQVSYYYSPNASIMLKIRDFGFIIWEVSFTYTF